MSSGEKKVLKGADAGGSRIISFICAAYITYLMTFHILMPFSDYSSISEAKYYSYMISSVAFIALTALVKAELKLVSPAKKTESGGHVRDIKSNAYIYAFAGFVLFSAISCILSDLSGTVFGNGRHYGLVTIAVNVICMVIISKNVVPKEWMLRVFGVSVCVFCAIGIVQLTGADPFSMYPDDLNFYDSDISFPGRYWSTGGNLGLCGAILSVAAGAFAVALISKRKRFDLLYAVPLFISVFSIIELKIEACIVALMGGLVLLPVIAVKDRDTLAGAFTTYGAVSVAAAASVLIRFYEGGMGFSFSAAGAALLAAGLVLAVIGAAVKKKLPEDIAEEKKIRCVILILICALAVSGLSFIYIYPDLPDGFLNEAHEMLHGNVSESFGSGRLWIWDQTAELIVEKPFFGGGPDTLGLRGLEKFSRFNKELGMTVTSTIDAAHNEYLHIIVNQGLFAAICYIAGFVITFLSVFKRRNDKAVLICGAALMFYCIQAFFGIAMCESSPFMWLAIAAANSTARDVSE